VTKRFLVAILYTSLTACTVQPLGARSVAPETSTPTTAVQRFADLGDLHLANGAVIRHCKLGYRIMGALNSNKSNAVLFPTWLAGRSADLVELVGPGKVLDNTKFFIIIVDAIGDGVSCSASNSVDQHGTAFPQYSIADMVEAEHRLVTEALHLKQLHAVVGISMGGMQAFEWLVAYPAFMSRVVPIVGSPQPTSYDLLFWNAVLTSFKNDQDWRGGNYSKNPSLALVKLLVDMNLSTPDFRVNHTARVELPRYVEDITRGNADDFDANDRYQQIKAIVAFDLARGENLQSAAAKVKARAFIVSSQHDHMVNPLPALRFAQMLGAKTLVLDSDCGHGAPMCQMDKLSPAISAFLDAK
jgi:homoserine O-acetyltransferase/O-succinyltransferase